MYASDAEPRPTDVEYVLVAVTVEETPDDPVAVSEIVRAAVAAASFNQTIFLPPTKSAAVSATAVPAVENVPELAVGLRADAEAPFPILPAVVKLIDSSPESDPPTSATSTAIPLAIDVTNELESRLRSVTPVGAPPVVIVNDAFASPAV